MRIDVEMAVATKGDISSGRSATSTIPTDR
jgi:hypothetical protein